ncbi:MAG: topA [Alphaproteobacteria bacterium]|jgi:DNA topoisomerase-1|nr:topA [Alphaproteobacteria bacterium]
MDVIVVESPAKAKTIEKYLGPGYTVLASFGHVRDLPPKDGSVRPDEDFAMSWIVDAKAEKRLNDIARAVKGAKHLYLATDPDREGEAISWHVHDILKDKGVLKGVDVKRIVFNAITKRAVTEALEHPRDLDDPLIDAYRARRALDYLVGFTLSPVLWRKLPGSRSAGRVQSVALRLICEREAEIEVFKSQEYWTVEVDFLNARNQNLTARLTHLNGQRLDKFDLDNETKALAAVETIEHRVFAVTGVDRKQVKRNPPPPFITSTLQQDASRRLGFGAGQTMRTAQRLYEGASIGGETVGLITYMRTDGVQMAPEGLSQTRRLIETRYGKDLLPEKPRFYSSKAKNAQEAHECIRPTDLFRTPDDVARYLDRDQLRLYELIWKRTVASQMESAVLDQVTIDIASADRNVQLRATGSVVKEKGFLVLYEEGKDEDKEDGEEKILPDVTADETLTRKQTRPEQHFTEPPPRYSEASLVKKMEELGIGRPSTYASIIEVLQARNYVKLDRKRFIPEDRGRIVTAFLDSYFKRYVEYDFTAKLEEDLDEVSGGRIDWRQVLRDFWTAFAKAVDETKDLRVKEVLDKLDADLGPHFFPESPNGRDPRKCPSCADGRIGLKLGKFGAFIGCSNYPECRFTKPLAVSTGEEGEASLDQPRELGLDPKTELMVTVRKGPYGNYVQLGEAKEKEKPKRVSLPKQMSPLEITLEQALGLLGLPREVGLHPESGQMITAGLGRFGPYVKHGPTYKSLAGDDDVLTVGLNRAVSLIADAKPGRGRTPPLKVLGEHPDDKQPVELYSGRYGHYVKHGKVNATVPNGIEPMEITLEQAIPLLAARAAKGKPVKAKKAAKAKAAKPKAAKKADDEATPEGETAAAKPAAKPAKAKAKAPAKKKAAKATAKPAKKKSEPQADAA